MNCAPSAGAWKPWSVRRSDRPAMTDAVRIDKWLWAARFFKTRTLARDAVRGGHVAVNGQRCKPARDVTAGDRLRITRGQVVFEIEVLAVAETRGPATRARALYAESEESRRRRTEEAARRRAERASAPVPDGRPDKRQRRALQRLRQRGDK